MVSIVLFHNTTSAFAKVIAWFENSPLKISHSALKVEVDGVPWILHAAWSGIAFVPMANIMSNHTVVAEFEIIPDVEKEFDTAKGKVGQAYDALTLLGYIPVVLGRYLHIGVNNPFYSKSAEVCSELIVEMDIDHKICEFDSLDPADIMPQDLYNICCVGVDSFRRLV